MKKHGFTLAEVLITLGIIGVVAALTAPALIQSAGNAKIGPTLQKVVSTLETANEQMLVEEEASSLYSLANQSDILYGEDGYQDAMHDVSLTYMALLSKYITGSSYETDTISSTDGAINAYEDDGNTYSIAKYSLFHFSDSIDIYFANFKEQTKISKGSFKGMFAGIIVDINGLKTGPNTMAKDLFFFKIDNNGSVIPDGSRKDSFAYGAPTWDTEGYDYTCNEDTVQVGFGCAGSIFDNNLKVIYQ